MLTLERLGFLFVASLLLAGNIVLSFLAFCAVALILWRFTAGLDANGVLVVPEGVAAAAVAVYLVGLFMFVWINRRKIKDEILSTV